MNARVVEAGKHDKSLQSSPFLRKEGRIACIIKNQHQMLVRCRLVSLLLSLTRTFVLKQPLHHFLRIHRFFYLVPAVPSNSHIDHHKKFV